MACHFRALCFGFDLVVWVVGFAFGWLWWFVYLAGLRFGCWCLAGFCGFGLPLSVVRLVLCSVGLGLFLGRGGSFAVCWLDLYNFCGIACWWFDVGRVWCWVLLTGLGLLYVGELYLIPLAVVVLLWNFSFWFGVVFLRGFWLLLWLIVGCACDVFGCCVWFGRWLSCWPVGFGFV